LNKNFNLILFVLLSSIGSTTILHSGYGNAIDVSEKNIKNVQLQDSPVNENIVDLKVSERNNNFVWTSVNGQVNPELDLK
jgi:hypothetical protein